MLSVCIKPFIITQQYETKLVYEACVACPEHGGVCISDSLVPRPPPSFPSLAVLQATESWAGAWERGYISEASDI